MAPDHVSIALTNACDLSCSHCYAPKQKVTLDFNLLTNWLRILDLDGCMGVDFGMGLMNKMWFSLPAVEEFNGEIDLPHLKMTVFNHADNP